MMRRWCGGRVGFVRDLPARSERLAILGAAIAVAILGACGDPATESSERDPESSDSHAAPESGDGFVGDLAAIRERGELRVLALSASALSLPRAGSPLVRERALVGELAADLGVDIRWVPVARLEDLIPALIAGRGDLVADNLTITKEREACTAFSAPIASVREQVVVRADTEGLRGPADLEGRDFVVEAGSSFQVSLVALRSQYEGIKLTTAPDGASFEEILRGVADGTFDLTLADSNMVVDALTWIDGLKVAFDVGEPRIIAWAMRPENRELRRAVDQFLSRAADLGGTGRDRHLDDLAAMKERKVLRVLTRNSATTYFIWKGELFGFEYELIKRFAEANGMRIQMVVAPSREDLVPWLLDGRGDVIAAGLTASDERAAREGVEFSRKYHEVVSTVVARTDQPAPETLDDLAGRTIVVRKSSSYWPSLLALQQDLQKKKGATFELEAAPEEQETEEIIARVASGEFDLTVADSHILSVELVYRNDIQAGVSIGEPGIHGWAVRPDNANLLAAINTYWKKEYRGLFYNITANKYFKNDKKIRSHVEHRAESLGHISEFDEITRGHAATFGFDWRLISSQMYQESRFDPDAKSFAGALGLLQVMPRTAKELGVRDEHLSDPDVGIETGVRYLSWVRDRFEASLPNAERTWFSLAAYNVGTGHVRDARKLAKQRGLDPDLWFGNVEQAMLLKEKREVHRTTRFGYCRGSEPVKYVRAIRDRYGAYIEIAPSSGPATSAQ